MAAALPPSLLLTLTFLSINIFPSAPAAACHDTCGSTQVKFPFGTGPGCGSPLFSPYITCASNGTADQLFLKTHSAATYPITSISYDTSTLTLAPSSMSSCSAMHPATTSFSLDWTSPFQLTSTTFLLLSCHPSLSLSSPLCDPSFDYLCASIYTCPAVTSLGLPLFPPSNSCCVYSPANLDGNGKLDLKAMQCGAYASVVSLGDTPTDPSRWVYGVALKFSYGGALDNNLVTTKCSGCESSGGVCGFSEPGNGFLCVCKGGYNTSFDCSPAYNQNQDYLFDSASAYPFFFLSWFVWSSILAGLFGVPFWLVLF